ncbi:general secretion pathway protein I [Natronocella acetinitrilica]|jgi:general secretion pathway protein I|uniref:Type II secretion system protein I n=1 Tax=Natronocella acetinitrilica TaxID=414046 RepID=A0AAE3G062_9GAMM|nr:type II secretion system minor pseudopilin GspI [Natronocella acetinitrilica]MCP1673036.1 general secretion pathway protein I [Natronocella acetinitrilica]
MIVHQRQGGFTLPEVMIALLVVAIAFAGLITATSQFTWNISHSRDRILANWVAGNVMTELQATRYWETGRQTGEMTMGPRDWFWEARVANTANPRLRRVDIFVYADPDDDNHVTSLIGLLQNPASTAPLPQFQGGG